MNSLRCRAGTGLLLKTVARLLLAVIFWGLGLCGMEGRAQGGGVSEYAVKAAFMGKFPQFIKWPSGGGSPTVGVLGDDPFGGALRARHSSRVEELKGCQIIFIAKSERGSVGAILSGLAGTNTLTVGESEGFARQGGIIGFTLDGDKVRFEINLGAAKRNGLVIDPRLAQLAARVVN